VLGAGDDNMSGSFLSVKSREFDHGRRTWLRLAGYGAAAWLGAPFPRSWGGQEPDAKLPPLEQAKIERERALDRVRSTTSRQVVTVTSERYQAVGDAAESFLKIALGDCELIADDYLAYYQSKGFDVKTPQQKMTLVVFREKGPYREFARKFAKTIPAIAAGFYSRVDNWLVLYDFRNVPADERVAVTKNARTLAHEATHQLTCNSGLLSQRGDVPLAITEGLACYGETRRLRGHTEPGQKNGLRLDNLAYIQRRVKWIKASELLTDDALAFGNTVDERLFGYAESWLLVYHLMKLPRRLVQLQAYLKAIYPRVAANHRLEDAERHFGDLDRLDQELHRTALRLQKDPGP
jgi:hypothetical protein